MKTKQTINTKFRLLFYFKQIRDILGEGLTGNIKNLAYVLFPKLVGRNMDGNFIILSLLGVWEHFSIKGQIVNMGLKAHVIAFNYSLWAL